MDQELIQRLMAMFFSELEEHIGTLNRDLLVLEKDPATAERTELLAGLFRAAHSLKGAARSLSIGQIETACHELEDLLSAARDGRVELTPDLFSLLFQRTDAIEAAGRQLEEHPELLSFDAVFGAEEEAGESFSTEGSGEAVASQPADATVEPADAIPTENGTHAAAAAKAQIPTPPASALSEHGIIPSIEAAQQGVDLNGASHPAIQNDRATIAAAQNTAAKAAASFAKPASTEPSRRQSADDKAVVRIAAQKLDALLAWSGELLVARRRVADLPAELAGLRQLARSWREDWQEAERSLKQVGQPLALEEARAARGGIKRLSAAVRHAGETLRRVEKEIERLSGTMVANGRALEQVSMSLEEEVRRARMLPFAEACHGLERVVRDVSSAGGKEVELRIEGGEVELDRTVIEQLRNPLRHLVTNGVDHGIETPSEREAAGKPRRATVAVRAILRGGQVEVVVTDNGRGLNLDAIRDKCRKNGLAEPSDPAELARVIFQPGFSTAKVVTEVSGRGVGLDVVKSQIEALHGTVDVMSEFGKGLKFTLTVPLTLSIARALLVRAAGQTFALAASVVQQLLRIDQHHLKTIEGRPALILAGVPTPVASLAATLGLSRGGPLEIKSARTPTMIVSVGEMRMAFLIDELLGEQEIMVKTLGRRIKRAPNISGATLLPSGQVALLLNAGDLMRAAIGQSMARAAATAMEARPASIKKRLVVADDSVTTRSLEKSILEGAGYEVAVAADGEAALQLLNTQGADLLVSDVDMPRLNGFGLAQALRSTERFKDLPIVLVTSRDTEEDRARGIEAGANAYLPKGAFDQRNLLETVAQLL